MLLHSVVADKSFNPARHFEDSCFVPHEGPCYCSLQHINNVGPKRTDHIYHFLNYGEINIY